MASNGGEENARSTSVVIGYGKVKIAAFGDLTWDREDLFCPINKVGKVDVYPRHYHGTALVCGSPASVNAMAPIVTIMGNSARKNGNDPARVGDHREIAAQSGPVEAARPRPPAGVNGDPRWMANPDADQTLDKFHALRLRIERNGKITVINERNGFNKRLPGP